MDLTQLIRPGMTHEESLVVEEKHLAPHVGSGAVRVLATPFLIGLMEAVSHRLLMEHLPVENSSVGTRVDMRHLAATPLGDTIRIRSEVTGVDGLTVSFTVDAWDTQDKIGECRHERFVIDVERFLKKVTAKADKLKK